MRSWTTCPACAGLGVKENGKLCEECGGHYCVEAPDEPGGYKPRPADT